MANFKAYQQAVLPAVITMGLLFGLGLLYAYPLRMAFPLLQRLEAVAYDLRMQVTATGKQPDDFPPIYIVDIDEASLEREGQWPWGRHKLAGLVDVLHGAGAAAIALDITLAEPERNPVDLLAAAWPDTQPLPPTIPALRDKLDADKALAAGMRDKGVILGYLFYPNSDFRKGAIKGNGVEVGSPLAQLSSVQMQGYTANLPLFTEAASGNGFFTILPDGDGVVRRAPLVLELDGQLYTSLALETARHYLGAGQEPLLLETAAVGDMHAITQVVLAGQAIPTDASGQIEVPYLGRSPTFPYLSATDVLHRHQLPDLTDAVVLVGTSAQALADLRTTPLQPSFPGVEVQATLVHALLNPEIIPFMPDWAQGALVTELVVLGLIMLLVFPLLSPGWLVLGGTALLGGVLGFNFWLWQVRHIHLEVILPLLLVVTITTLYALHRLFREHRERGRIHGMFGQYVPLTHIDRLLEQRVALGMEGERREMSVLFSDIRNFTALSEPLPTQQLKRFLNHYLTPVTAIIFRHQGTIDKYVGDLVMAFWGAPLPDAQHAEHAVRAALDMRAKIGCMQDEFRALGIGETVSAGIGINSGEMNVGDMGSNYRRAYTVLGDAVNLGSRLEGLTGHYGVHILVSEDTRQQCPAICFRPIDCVRVKGRHEPVLIHEPLCLQSELTPALSRLLGQHRLALDAYLQGDWATASKLFAALQAETQEPLYQVYLKRMQSHDGLAPEGWAGVFTHGQK